MIISISGSPGSGKSTIAKNLLKELSAKRVYVGGIRRELAREKGMTLEELNKYALDNPETDVDVDKRAAIKARELEKQGYVVIAEGRTQFHVLPESLKLYIKVNPREGARRIFKEVQESDQASSNRNQDTVHSIEEAEQKALQRDEQDAQRYLKYYKVDHRDESNYDFILDTTHISAKEATNKVLEFINSQQNL